MPRKSDEGACPCGWELPKDLSAETDDPNVEGELRLLFVCPKCGADFALRGTFSTPEQDGPN